MCPGEKGGVEEEPPRGPLEGPRTALVDLPGASKAPGARAKKLKNPYSAQSPLSAAQPRVQDNLGCPCRAPTKPSPDRQTQVGVAQEVSESLTYDGSGTVRVLIQIPLRLAQSPSVSGVRGSWSFS